jgi:MFS family permease
MTTTAVPLPRTSSRSLLLLAAATATGSLGLAAGGVAAALLAVAMTGRAAAAGLPLGALAAGQAGASLLVGRLTGRSGRGAGLVLGYALGVAGATTVLVAAMGGGFAVMLAGSVLLGGANASVFLARYAAADLGGSQARGRALGTVLFAAAVGTIAGPALLVPTGRLAQAVGLPQLTGLYLLAVVAFAGAGLAVAALTRGGLASLGQVGPSTPGPRGGRRPESRGRLAASLRRPPVRAALVVLGATNLVMVAIMAVTPLLLMAHGHHLGFVGLAVSVHVLGMFAPSPATGWLADRVGGAAVAWAGMSLLVLAGVGGAVADHDSGPAMVAVLVVLGLGWNGGVVGGSAMLAASVPAGLRPRSEGIGEASMGLAAAAGAPAAGVLVAIGGFGALCLAGAAVATVVLAGARRRSVPATTRPAASVDPAAAVMVEPSGTGDSRG